MLVLINWQTMRMGWRTASDRSPGKRVRVTLSGQAHLAPGGWILFCGLFCFAFETAPHSIVLDGLELARKIELTQNTWVLLLPLLSRAGIAGLSHPAQLQF